MSDLISRQAMIDTMKRRRTLFCKNRIEFIALPKDEKARVDEIDNCIADLINAPSTDTERKWIPVTEALPEEMTMVLVTCADGTMRTSVLTDITYWSGIGRGGVIAWMLLPEPWRGE